MKKNRRALIMIGVFAVLILANLFVHSRRGRPAPGTPPTIPQSGSSTVTPGATPVSVPLAPPAPAGGQTGTTQPVVAQPPSPPAPLTGQGFAGIPGGSGAADWSKALTKIEDLEKRVESLPVVFPAPPATDSFRAPSHDPLHWALPASPVLEPLPASAPVTPGILTASPTQVPPGLIGVFLTRGKKHILLRDQNGVHSLTEGETNPQAPWHLVSLQDDGATIRDKAGNELAIVSPEVEEKQRLAQIRNILEGNGPPMVFHVLSSVATSTNGGNTPSPAVAPPVPVPAPAGPPTGL